MKACDIRLLILGSFIFGCAFYAVVSPPTKQEQQYKTLGTVKTMSLDSCQIKPIK